MRLAEQAGLHGLLERQLSVRSAHAATKASCVVAGMLAGADSIDDLDVLRHGGMAKVFSGIRAPSTLGTFLRSFTFGHVRHLDAVHSRVLAGLAAAVPRLLAGTDGMAFVDIDDTLRQVHGYAKQGAAYGYSGVKGLNAQVAALSSPTCAPVIAAARLRKGNVVSGHGADRLIVDAIATARSAGATGAGDGPGRLRVLPPGPHRRRGPGQGLVLGHRANESLRPAGDRGDPGLGVDGDSVPAGDLGPRPGGGGSPKRRSPRSTSPRSPPTPRNGRSGAGWSSAASNGSTRRRARDRTSCSPAGGTTGSSPTPLSPRSPRTRPTATTPSSSRSSPN